MAIDTRNKRASSLMIGLPFGRVWPLPDGTITEADFEHESYLYSGIQSGAVFVDPFPTAGEISMSIAFFEADRPSRPRFIDGFDDPTEASRLGTRAMQGRPRRPPGTRTEQPT